MKRILGFAATAILASTVNAAANDDHVTVSQHSGHHQNAQETKLHAQKYVDATAAAHLHDHKGNAKQAAKHVSEHHGSQTAAHNHDHENDDLDAHAHVNDHAAS